MNPDDLWRFLPGGYLLTVLIETPVLLLGLSSRHSVRERLFAGLWLTAVTYPIVVLVLPVLMLPRWSYVAYLAVAETFAPAAECLLFRLMHRVQGPLDRTWLRDFGVIALANLLSFGVGMLSAPAWR